MDFVLSLLQNGAFLLALVLIYEVLSRRPVASSGVVRQVVTGLAVSGIAAVIMLTPLRYAPGIILDTRSVLISLSGLFFGTIPTLITVVTAAIVRWYIGGVGVGAGILTVLVTAAIGLSWRWLRRPALERISLAELYLFGVIVHAVVLLLMSALPREMRSTVMLDFAAPFLLLYPVITLFLGRLLSDGIRRNVTDRDLGEERERLVLAMAASNQSLFDANLQTGKVVVDVGGSAPARLVEGPAYLSDWFRSVHPQDRDRVLDMYRAISSGKRAFCEISFRQQAGDATWRWLACSGRVVGYDSEGRPLRMLGTIRDITAAREAEEQLILLRRLLDHSLDGFQIFDPATGGILDVNDMSCTELGYTREELLGMTIFDIEENLGPARYQEMVAALRERGSMNWESAHRRKDGTTYPIEAKLNFVSLEREYIVAAVRNITLRRAMEESLRNETLRRHNLIEQSRDGMVTLDEDGNVFEANNTFAEMLGYTRDEVHRLSIFDWEKNFPRETVLEKLRAVDETGNHFETRHTRKDGSVFDVEISSNATTINGRKLIFCVCRDVTERKQTQASLQLAAMVYQNSREAMMVIDSSGKIVAINPTFTKITGYTLEEVIGRNPRMLQSGEHPPEFYEAMWAELHRTGHWSGEVMDRRKNGEVYPEWLSINAVYDDEGNVQSWVAQFSDITEKKGAEQMIWQQANFDALTGLPNRRMFQERLNQDIRSARRSGKLLALLFLDLDNFKEVNDTLGHDMGDRLLKQTAERLRDCVRETDTIARLGGDEFTLILPNLSNNADVGMIARKILWKLSEPFRLETEIAYVSASIGITLYPSDAIDAEGLLKCADQAMYGAKEDGRNCYRYFTRAMQEAVTRRMRLTNDLREALVTDQLNVAYQPIVNLSNGLIRKAEALVRWTHPREGLMGPADFIRVAEESGLIGSIGGFVLDNVIRNCRRWREFIPDMQISINKSPAEFEVHGRRSSVEDSVGELLQKAHLPGDAVVVEITEGMILSARPEVLAQIEDLRGAGVQIALDDFGTGYSSLSYLKKFDIDYLKIDQTFIVNLGQKEEDLALCEAIITMAHRLGIAVVAEGVETSEQMRLLKEIGCDYAQGYLFSPPVSPEEMELLLRRQSALAMAQI